MQGERPYLRRDFPANRAGEASIVEKRDVLQPGQPDHHPQAVARRFVEQSWLRDRIHPNRVDARLRHGGEVVRNSLWRRELLTLAVGSERPVRDTLDEHTGPADIEKFPFNTWPSRQRCRLIKVVHASIRSDSL